MVQAWAARHGWTLEFDLDALTVAGVVTHPADGVGQLYLLGDCSGYRAVPPAWTFVDPDSGATIQHAFPARGRGATIFHQKLIICAPFNRLAYKECGGPHADWSGPSNWLHVTRGVKAPTIADMLNVINAHLQYSPGRMA
jgi:hypothetical protein